MVCRGQGHFRRRRRRYGRHTVRTSRDAAVGVVAELVDVHASLGIGVVAADVVGDGGGRGLVALLEGHCPSDLRVSAEDSDCGWKGDVSTGSCSMAAGVWRYASGVAC
jgi:hypothetical protein